MIEKYPEIFSEEIKKGCKFHGFVESSRQKLKMKRLFFFLLFSLGFGLTNYLKFMFYLP